VQRLSPTLNECRAQPRQHLSTSRAPYSRPPAPVTRQTAPGSWGPTLADTLRSAHPTLNSYCHRALPRPDRRAPTAAPQQPFSGFVPFRFDTHRHPDARSTPAGFLPPWEAGLFLPAAGPADRAMAPLPTRCPVTSPPRRLIAAPTSLSRSGPTRPGGHQPIPAPMVGPVSVPLPPLFNRFSVPDPGRGPGRGHAVCGCPSLARPPSSSPAAESCRGGPCPVYG
jgi:hypothetical protein